MASHYLITKAVNVINNEVPNTTLFSPAKIYQTKFTDS